MSIDIWFAFVATSAILLITTPSAPGSRWRLFLNTYLVTALNPKGIVFFVAFLPQFINPNAAVRRLSHLRLRDDGLRRSEGKRLTRAAALTRFPHAIKMAAGPSTRPTTTQLPE